MAKFKNVSPFGTLITPYGQVEVDEVFDVPEDEADGLRCQPLNFVEVDDKDVKAKKPAAK